MGVAYALFITNMYVQFYYNKTMQLTKKQHIKRDGIGIKEMSNIEKITALWLTDQSFKAAVYDYVALFDSFNIAEFINWLNE